LFVGDREVITTAFRLLSPYEGRSVINAGAVMFHGVTDDTLARAAGYLGEAGTADRLSARAVAAYERLGARWWRDRLRSSTPPARAGSPRVHLHPVPGGLWLVGADRMTAPLRELRGFGYLRELIRRPGVLVSALDLIGAGSGVAVESGLGELVDKQALSAYRQRLRELDQELTDADGSSDVRRSVALTAERDALLDELGRATGLGGRPRTTGSSQERARIAVTKAIRAAIDRIATVDEPLSRHLRSTVQTGLSCRYEPDPGDRTEWALD
jgi:hypothetical protein